MDAYDDYISDEEDWVEEDRKAAEKAEQKRRAKEAEENREAELRATQPVLIPLHPYMAYKLELSLTYHGAVAVGRGAAAVTMEQIEGLRQRAVFVPFGLSRR